MDLREQLQSTLGPTYALDQELGGSGMSRVFVATDVTLGRRIVVKAMSPDLIGRPSTRGIGTVPPNTCENGVGAGLRR
jgi:hypothetical protein